MPLRQSRNSSSRHSILNDNSLLGNTESQPLLACDNKKEQSWISSDSSICEKNDDFVTCDLKENQTENDERIEEKSDKISEKLVIKRRLFDFLKFLSHIWQLLNISLSFIKNKLIREQRD